MKNKLKEIRLNKGLTQQQFAEKIGMNVTSYLLIEKGISTPKIKTLNKISNYLNVSVEELRKWQ